MNEHRSDVFLSHHSADKAAVEEIARQLLTRGVTPWLDIWNLVPGVPWQDEIERALDHCSSIAVFIGPTGSGPWQNEEMRAAINRRVQDTSKSFRVIPVFLPGTSLKEIESLPTFLKGTTSVKFPNTTDDGGLYRLMCGIQGRSPGPDMTAGTSDGRCPYRGLRVFDVDDSDLFFGREAVRDRALHALRPAPPGPRQTLRFLALIGPSGSGKSSLARAGLLAAVRRGELPGSGRWPIAICRPGADPVENVAVALAALGPGDNRLSQLTQLVHSVRDDEKTIHLFTRLMLHPEPPDSRLVLLIDQFEELFTTCPDEALRRAFLRNISYAAGAIGGQCTIVITLRADFYGRCALYPELADMLPGHQSLLAPMSREELRLAIEHPAEITGCAFERGLVDALLQDAINQAGALPLLQHALLEMWERRSGSLLTHAAYEAIGRMAGALERRAEAIYAEFDAAHQQICRLLFLRLTQPGHGSETTKRRVPIAELLSLQDHVAVQAVLDRMVAADARLLTTQGTTGAYAESVVEISHEALIHSWDRLRQWLDEDRANQVIQHRLSESANEWLHNERNDGFLYRGLRLAEATAWAQQHDHRLSEMEREFLADSADLAAQETRVSDAAAIDQLELSAPAIWLDDAAMEHWLSRGEILAAGLERHHRQLERYRRGCHSGLDAIGKTLWHLSDPERQFEHDTLSTLIARLERFRGGLLAAGRHVFTSRRSLRKFTIDDHAVRWSRAVDDIASLVSCPQYRGLRIAPQCGLVPIGKDPASGLWEFASLMTGIAPTRLESGELELGDMSAVVLVLLPGGAFEMGAVQSKPDASGDVSNIDPHALDDEGPVHTVCLAPFFMAKHQMTQGQWLHLQGYNPSMFRAEPSNHVTLLHPVECVSWDDCMRALPTANLTLPTEAQWEYAARAGTATVWYVGNDPSSLRDRANLMMASHTPVGYFKAANNFGLLDVIGNVWEWCADRYASYMNPAVGNDGRRDGADGMYLSRGGSFFNTPAFARSAIRYFQTVADARFNNRGLRPARALKVSRGDEH